MNKLFTRFVKWLSREKPRRPTPPRDQECPADLRQAIWEEVVGFRKGLVVLAPASDPLPAGFRLVIRTEICRHLDLPIPDPEATLVTVPRKLLNMIRETILVYMEEPLPQ